MIMATDELCIEIVLFGKKAWAEIPIERGAGEIFRGTMIGSTFQNCRPFPNAAFTMPSKRDIVTF
jgi:hypothetical protein